MILDSLIRCFLTQSMSRRLAAGVGVLAVAAMAALSTAQQAATRGGNSLATVTFTLDFPQSNPEHYSIAVDAAGHARYECAGTIAQDSEQEAYKAEFQVSAGNREKIFAWTKQARYFAGKIDSGNRKLAFTGTKLLSYQDGQISNTARYNYSNLAAVQQLTALFQSMGATLDYGRRLTYYHRYQKLALDDELKRMETQARNNELDEIQGVESVLQEIFEDASVINVVRARAKELIEIGKSASEH
jgi:hypothetical protein